MLMALHCSLLPLTPSPRFIVIRNNFILLLPLRYLMDRICRMLLAQSPPIANQDCAFDMTTTDGLAKIFSSFKPSHLYQYQWSFAPR